METVWFQGLSSGLCRQRHVLHPGELSHETDSFRPSSLHRSSQTWLFVAVTVYEVAATVYEVVANTALVCSVEEVQGTATLATARFMSGS